MGWGVSKGLLLLRYSRFCDVL